MIWLCISLPQLPLEALLVADQAPATVVTTCESNTRWTICCNTAAAHANLKAMMNCTVALAIQPEVVMLERRLDAEKAALQRLASWAYQFSATVIIGDISPEPHHARSSTLWLEIGASMKLFGGFRRFMEHLEHELGELRYTYQLGVAPTLEGAALLARSGIRIAITTKDALCRRIRTLPISKLELLPEITQQLHIAGVRSIGLLLELPRDGVARRFGPEITLFLDRLTGEAADPRPVFQMPERYDAHVEFEFEVRGAEALLFTLRRLLREFSGYLRARDTGVERFVLHLMHREIPATQLHIGLSTPERNADRFFVLAREHLERSELSAPIIGLRVCASQFAAPTALQPELFSGKSRNREALSHTLDRIVARLGDTHVYGLKSVADHRPEASWSTAALDEKRATPRFPERPLWLLPEPRPLQLSAIPQIASGPERIEVGWWDGGDVRRDYFIVRTSNGADLWVYQDLRDHSWHLHGFWS
jgi:protein ImuB